MDFTDSFQHSIAGKAFLTFDEFQKELEAFTEVSTCIINTFWQESGSQFILKKRLRHNLGHSMRDVHQYRYAHFVCAYAFSTDCEAFFTIASKSSCLRVVQFFMAHNHAVIYNPAFRQRDPNDEDGYEVRCDLSKEFESSFPAKHFGTYEEFEEQLKKFQAKTQSIYIKRNACRWPADAPEKQHLVYRRLKIECVHYGQRKRNKPNKPNIKFPTFDDFASRLEEFQRETGCFYSRRSTVVWPSDAYGKEHLKYKFVIYDCVHYGSTRSTKRCRRTKRNNGFCFKNKVGCRSSMRISSAKGYVEILSYEMRHNHPPSLEASGEYQPHSWLLSGISINEEEGLVVKRRRRAKNRYNERQPKAETSHVLSDPNVELIRPQLEKLRELALSASTDRFHAFVAQLSDFESEWKARLNFRSRQGQYFNCTDVPAVEET
ncbi:unnamed protein product [Dibothriocephalus latus]|uniref:FAR1 domain-containing protein n=1 Tax=Dibothriocephalus latus TaxID=60516 RepID=A0A3P7LT79_DIBLA|nr:unnamed protein product [Dibothriocephalus latus]